MILCSAEPRIISCLPTHVINLVINDNSLEILYIYSAVLVHRPTRPRPTRPRPRALKFSGRQNVDDIYFEIFSSFFLSFFI